jgi:hypothetical protein
VKATVITIGPARLDPHEGFFSKFARSVLRDK